MGYKTVQDPTTGAWILQYVPDDEEVKAPTPEKYWLNFPKTEAPLPKVTDWTRTLSSPQAEASGRIGGIESTARQVQPLAALDIPAYQTPSLPTVSSWQLPKAEKTYPAPKVEPFPPVETYKIGKGLQPEIPTYEPPPYQPEQAEQVKKSWEAQAAELGGEAPVTKSLLDTILGYITTPFKAQGVSAAEEKPSYIEPLPGTEKGWLQRTPYEVTPAGKESPMFKGWATGTETKEFTPSATTPPKAKVTDTEKMVKEWGKTGKTDLTYFDTSNDSDTYSVISLMAQEGMPLPQLSNERLSRIKDPTVIGNMWQAGYKLPQVIEATSMELDNIRKRVSQSVQIDIADNVAITSDELSKLDYKSLVNAVDFLGRVSDDDWRRIDEEGIVYRPNFSFTGFDSFGNKQYQFQGWYQDTKYETEAEKTRKQTEKQREQSLEQQRWEWQQYWTAEATEQRNRQREDSYQWNLNKSNEGWGSYYQFLDSLKLPPEANEYFSSAAQFNELRRRWQTSGGGLPWEQWLAQNDFMKEWNQRRPTERGEKPYLYKSRIRRVSY